MTITTYEQQGGFKEELQLMREIGQRITTLTEKIKSRPFRGTEMNALCGLMAAEAKLADEIRTTRGMA